MINFRKTIESKELLNCYSEYLANKNKSKSSIQTYLNPNRQFIQFLEEKSVRSLRIANKEHLMEFQAYLYDVKDFKRSSVKSFIKQIKLFLSYLIQINEIQVNIAQNIKILPEPQLPKKQLAHFYTFDEIIRRYFNDRKKWISYSYSNSVNKHIKGFIKYLISNDINSIYVVNESVLIKYRQFLWEEFVQMHDDALVVRSQIERLRCVVKLFRYLSKEGIYIDNPARNLDWEHYYKEIIAREKSLPKCLKEENELTELDELSIKFIEYEKGKGKSISSIKQYKKGLSVFFEYLKKKGVANLAQVNKRLLLDYFNYICGYIGERGNPASNSYKNHLLWSMKLFFRFLVRFEYLQKDPSLDVEGVKEGRGLPYSCMTKKEIEKLLEKPNISNDVLSVRDKAIMEVLFSTGIRSNELCSLDIEDINYQEGLIRINTPKGGADYQRIIPIGKEAIKCVNKYLQNSRPEIQNGDGKALFLSYSGHRLQNEAILNIVKKYAFQCGFRKKITTHSLRVTCATLMLKNGADIRYVQEQLGHKRITSTQRYTRLIPQDLKSVHSRCHPRERKTM